MVLSFKKIKWIVFAFAALALGIGFLGHGLSVVRGLKNAADVKDTEISSYDEDMWIKGTTDCVWYYYCSGLSGEDGPERYRWYLVRINVPVSAESDGKECFLGVKVPSSEFDNYETLRKETKKYDLTFQGKLVKCTGDVKRLKNEYVDLVDETCVKEEGVRASQKYVFPDYYIDLTTTKTGNRFVAVGIFSAVGGLVLLAYMLYSIRKAAKYAEAASAERVTSTGISHGYGTAGTTYPTNSVNGSFGQGGMAAVNNPPQNESVGAATGFYRQDDQDELSRMLAEEDQKVANYNFKAGLSGSNRVEDDE